MILLTLISFFSINKGLVIVALCTYCVLGVSTALFPKIKFILGNIFYLYSSCADLSQKLHNENRF